MLHPLIFGETCGHNFVGVLDVAARWNIHRHGHFYDGVGLRNIPAARPVRHWQRGVGVASQFSGLYPGAKSRNLLRRKRGIVCELADVRIGKPRRHRARCGQAHDFGGVARDLVVGFEWRRADALGAMTSLAMLLKDWQNVAIESGMTGIRLRMSRAFLRTSVYADRERGAR